MSGECTKKLHGDTQCAHPQALRDKNKVQPGSLLAYRVRRHSAPYEYEMGYLIRP